MSKPSGASVYISAAEIEALRDVFGMLSAVHETASDPGPELPAGMKAVHSLLDKAAKARRTASRRGLVKRALRAAAEG